ncbi:MAG TPA: GNAT family N-acetyltransferase [Deltaproteobacteria bacterium]|nr:GNAT family N-acetyltransferase [Deltaproteobacteria bacterium]
MADLDGLVELLRLLFAIEADFSFDGPRQRRGLAMMLDQAAAVILVAEAEGRVIGMCSGQLTISTAEGGVALLVEDVVVVKGWQGRGVGRRLMAALEQWAGARKVERLQLLADRNNQGALEFYATLGWQGTELVCLRKRLRADSLK